MAGDKSLTTKVLSFSNFNPPCVSRNSWRGREFYVGVLGNARTGAEFVGTRSVFPTEVPAELLARVQAVAVESFNALRLRDSGRVDLRVTPDEKVQVIEVNPDCYLEQSGEFARAAAESGLAHGGLVARIVELAQGRYSR